MPFLERVSVLQALLPAFPAPKPDDLVARGRPFEGLFGGWLLVCRGEPAGHQFCGGGAPDLLLPAHHLPGPATGPHPHPLSKRHPQQLFRQHEVQTDWWCAMRGTDRLVVCYERYRQTGVVL